MVLKFPKREDVGRSPRRRPPGLAPGADGDRRDLRARQARVVDPLRDPNLRGLARRDHPRDLREVVGILARGVRGKLLHGDPTVLSVDPRALPARIVQPVQQRRLLLGVGPRSARADRPSPSRSSRARRQGRPDRRAPGTARALRGCGASAPARAPRCPRGVPRPRRWPTHRRPADADRVARQPADQRAQDERACTECLENLGALADQRVSSIGHQSIQRWRDRRMPIRPSRANSLC